MRNMSFMLTTQQMRDRSKFVTRRLGWWNAKQGEVIMACVKCQGIRKGQGIEHITPIEVVTASGEQLKAINQHDVIREGFPHMTPADFIAMFCKAHKARHCTPDTVVNRIEFKFLDSPKGEQPEPSLPTFYTYRGVLRHYGLNVK